MHGFSESDFDGNGFSESDLVGRPSDPKPEIILRDLENICRERGVLVLSFRLSDLSRLFPGCASDCVPLCVFVARSHGRRVA